MNTLLVELSSELTYWKTTLLAYGLIGTGCGIVLVGLLAI